MKYLMLVLVIIIIVGGGFLLINAGKTAPSQTEVISTTDAAPTAGPTPEEGTTGSSGMAGETPAAVTPTGEPSATAKVKEFKVEGKSFSFTPAEIKVNKGDTVKIVFANTEGFHDWVIDEFNARTKKIQAGQSDTVTFVADKAGTFEYYCSVSNHRAQGMVGNLVVSE